MKKIYQIQIALKGTKPKIWRRVLVPSDMLLSDFHKVIQTCMGWTNSHLHQFIHNRTFYTVRMPEDDMWEEFNNVDYKKLMISHLLKAEKDKISYEYDFGDSWMHDIVLEKILPVDPAMRYPVCLAGKMLCPPEDCGGVWGFSEMLEVLKHPEHEEYETYREWLGEEYDPEEFDLVEINKLLWSKDYGCFEF